MRWKKARRSDNVVDARGRSGGFRGGRLSLAGVAVVVVIGLLSGQDPLQILGQLANQTGSVSTQQDSPAANGDDPQVAFVQSILGDTEDTWRALFQQSGAKRIVPDAFTHGTSAQRMKWFRTGFDSGEPARCDTFQASRL